MTEQTLVFGKPCKRAIGITLSAADQVRLRILAEGYGLDPGRGRSILLAALIRSAPITPPADILRIIQDVHTETYAHIKRGTR
jgi:hypothetical protein